MKKFKIGNTISILLLIIALIVAFLFLHKDFAVTTGNELADEIIIASAFVIVGASLASIYSAIRGLSLKKEISYFNSI